MVGEEGVHQLAFLLEIGQLAHASEVGGALDVQVLLRSATEHEREHDLHEEVGLEVGLGRDGFRQPCLYLALPRLGDRVALTVRTRPCLCLADDGLPVTGQPSEGGVHLTEGEGPAPTEVRVVVTLQVVAVPGFTVEEPEEGHGNAHTCEHTLDVYCESIGLRLVTHIARLVPVTADIRHHPDRPSEPFSEMDMHVLVRRTTSGGSPPGRTH